VSWWRSNPLYNHNAQGLKEAQSQDSLYTMDVKDSIGNILSEGDSVTLIKDLKVKGSSLNLKRGTIVKKIKLTDDPSEVDSGSTAAASC
jgi:protein PhnA